MHAFLRDETKADCFDSVRSKFSLEVNGICAHLLLFDEED